MTGADGPYPYRTRMSTLAWQAVPVARVRIASLVRLQGTDPEVVAAKRLCPTGSESGDLFPHVVEDGGRLYLNDGHHRVEALEREGETHVAARVLRELG